MPNKTLIGKKRVRMKERNSAFWESGEGGEKYPSSLARTRAYWVLFCENLYCLCIFGVKCFIIRWLTRESNAHLLSHYLRLLLRQVVSLICLIYMWFYVLWSDFIEKKQEKWQKNRLQGISRCIDFQRIRRAWKFAFTLIWEWRIVCAVIPESENGGDSKWS